jgi:hypothetical protein
MAKLSEVREKMKEKKPNVNCKRVPNCTGLDNCLDCNDVHNSISCSNLMDSKKCTNVHRSKKMVNCVACEDSSYLRHCIGCTNLHSKRFYILNEKKTEEEYEEYSENLEVDVIEPVVIPAKKFLKENAGMAKIPNKIRK